MRLLITFPSRAKRRNRVPLLFYICHIHISHSIVFSPPPPGTNPTFLLPHLPSSLLSRNRAPIYKSNQSTRNSLPHRLFNSKSCLHTPSYFIILHRTFSYFFVLFRAFSYFFILHRTFSYFFRTSSYFFVLHRTSSYDGVSTFSGRHGFDIKHNLISSF